MKKWLFNPFEKLAGWKALWIGMGVLFITAITAYYGHIHLDGVIDLHEAEIVPFSVCLLEGLINWLSMTLFIYIAGLFFSGSSFRFIDVIGTQALARFPVLISCLLSLACFDESILRYLEYTLLQRGEPVTLTAWAFIRFGFMALAIIVLLVWTISLMYKAYSTSCNVKGNKGAFSFAGALILAEVLSKVLIGCLI